MARLGIWVLLALMASGPALGATTSYGSLSAWQSSAGAVSGVETFDSITADTALDDFTGPFALSAAGTNAAFNGIEAFDPSGADTIQIDGRGYDRNVNGTTYFAGRADGTDITIAFSEAVLAVAWDQASVQHSGGLRATVNGETLGLGNGSFFGVVSDTAFTTISITGGDRAFGLDTFRWVAAAVPTSIPIPAGFPLTLSALLGLVWLHGRSRRGLRSEAIR